MIEKNSYVSVDEYGFVTGYIVTGVESPLNYIPAPEIVENSMEFFTENYYLENGVWKHLGKTPQYYKIDRVNKVFVPDVEELKRAKWLEIKQARQNEINSGLYFNGNIYDINPKSQTNISLIAQLAQNMPENWTTSWVLKNNTSVELTRLEVLQLNLAVAEKLNQLYQKSQRLRELIDSYSTIEQLLTINW